MKALVTALAALLTARAGDEAAGLRQALDGAVRDAAARRSMILAVECRTPAGLKAVRVSGDGMGIWNGERQFHMEGAGVVSILRALREADFPGLDERYGGPPEPSPAPTPGGTSPGGDFAVAITCRVELALGGHHKEVVQLARGHQSATLERLAETLLGICERPARSGLAASSLRDGLEKIARGALAPETWVVTLHRRPDPGIATRGRFLLAITGARATSRTAVPGQADEKELGLDLTRAEIRRLARRLAAADPAAWPVNLYARDYTDVSVRVLNHEVSIQARPFAGLQPSTHGRRQVAFEDAVAALDRLHERILASAPP